MGGGNQSNTLQTEAQKTRTSVVFSRQQQTMETYDVVRQVHMQEQGMTQTAAMPASMVRTAQEQTSRSACARRSAEKAFRKNRKLAEQRAGQYQKEAEQPELLIEQYLAGEEKKLGEVEPEQEGTTALESLRKSCLKLEYAAMEKVKDPVAAREFLEKLRYFQDRAGLVEKVVLRTAVRRNVLMPRLQAEGKLNEAEEAAICSQHMKALGNIATLSDVLDELRDSINSHLPAGEQIGYVSDAELEQYESQIGARAEKRAARSTAAAHEDPLNDLRRAREQVFAERNTRLPKTIANYDRRRRGLEQQTPTVVRNKRVDVEVTMNEKGEMQWPSYSPAVELGMYSQADYNLYRHEKRQEALGKNIDLSIRKAAICAKSEKNPVRKQIQEQRERILKQYREQVIALPADQAEQIINNYLSELSNNCAWSRRLPASIVELILDSEDHRIKTQFETNRSEAALTFESREQMAKEDFGTDIPSLESHEHENYGYLSDKNLERELAGDNMDSYGSVMVSFKKGMLSDRTTLALGDTLLTLGNGAIPCHAAHPDLSVVDRDRYPQILAVALAYADRKAQAQNAQDPEIFRELMLMGLDNSYAELQFHGDLKMDKDYVDQIMIIRRSYADEGKRKEENDRVDRIVSKLKDAGIENVVVQDKQVTSDRAAAV
ncbi:MAG: hypothetical protein Q4C65_06770 [Eubacteriales bacterium]|nr:hypothetical protein [Eubacteriales bacterium]